MILIKINAKNNNAQGNHIGEITQTQFQLIMPNNLSAINKIRNINVRLV